jgi:hypothetical protein
VCSHAEEDPSFQESQKHEIDRDQFHAYSLGERETAEKTGEEKLPEENYSSRAQNLDHENVA